VVPLGPPPMYLGFSKKPISPLRFGLYPFISLSFIGPGIDWASIFSVEKAFAM